MSFDQEFRELKFPKKKSYETEISYVLQLISNGYVLNSYICRYIGIAHLHSITPKLYDKGYDFSKSKGLAYCPKRKLIPPRKVITLYMTQDQQSQYRENKKEKAAKV